MIRRRKTIYLERAKKDLATYHATLRAIEQTTSFDRAIEEYGKEVPGMIPMFHQASWHWPDTLFKIESVMIISIFDVYVQSILFHLYMYKLGIDYDTYFKSWKKYIKKFRKWRLGRSTQNAGLVLEWLTSEDFNLSIEVSNSEKKILDNANTIRNRFVHSGSYHNFLDPETFMAFFEPEESEKDFIMSGKLGVLPNILVSLIEKIDEEVRAKFSLPEEIIVEVSSNR